ncbi:hypothetical protein M419DRAFT_119758 [Trichoderma reesei RUT C-30]|uniref:Uncharacterized protein n=1 Tax=Hypocrea jecorina (strain ATCC 56765 / BCRC 32924 / NRRL 11460 / Rut C-30) TaxID=1344414 RepID=A0A024S614_HYPJR|nr:hypothetical protein M419DRAFT_119758 [Trichoderma reesei RUT C-30]
MPRSHSPPTAIQDLCVKLSGCIVDVRAPYQYGLGAVFPDYKRSSNMAPVKADNWRTRAFLSYKLLFNRRRAIC